MIDEIKPFGDISEPLVSNLIEMVQNDITSK